MGLATTAASRPAAARAAAGEPDVVTRRIATYPRSAMSSPMTPPPSPHQPEAAPRPFARLGLFVLVSLVAGVLVAGAALPFVGGTGVAARIGGRELRVAALAARARRRCRSARASSPPTARCSRRSTSRTASRSRWPRSHRSCARRSSRSRTPASTSTAASTCAACCAPSPATPAATAASTQGGSTLTQQYVKNVLVETRPTRPRRRRPRSRAASPASSRRCATRSALEKTLTKDQILERYLNIAYFGAGAYGVEAASRRYFSKPASKLTLVEAATLAGIVQQPVAYDPTRNPKSSQKRRILVLGRMAELGYITPAVAKTAGAIPTTKFLKPSRTANGCTTSYAPFFCDYVSASCAPTRPSARRRRARGAAAPRRPHHHDHARPRGAGGGAEGRRQAHPAQGQEPQGRRDQHGAARAPARSSRWRRTARGASRAAATRRTTSTSAPGSAAASARRPVDVQGVHPRRGAARRALAVRAHRGAADQDLQGLQQLQDRREVPALHA